MPISFLCFKEVYWLADWEEPGGRQQVCGQPGGGGQRLRARLVHSRSGEEPAGSTAVPQLPQPSGSSPYLSEAPPTLPKLPQPSRSNPNPPEAPPTLPKLLQPSRSSPNLPKAPPTFPKLPQPSRSSSNPSQAPKPPHIYSCCCQWASIGGLTEKTPPRNEDYVNFIRDNLRLAPQAISYKFHHIVAKSHDLVPSC